MFSSLNLSNPHLTIERLCQKVRVALRRFTFKVVNRDHHIQEVAIAEVRPSIPSQSQLDESRRHYQCHRGGEKSLNFMNPIYPNPHILWKLKHSSGHPNR